MVLVKYTSRQTKSPSVLEYCSDHDEATELDMPKTPTKNGRQLKRSNAIANIPIQAPQNNDNKSEEAAPEPETGADWEMVEETPKIKKKPKAKTRELIKAFSESNAQEHDTEDNMVVSPTFL